MVDEVDDAVSAGTLRPALSRRRPVGHTSARSLLMTLLGEFLLPHGEPVWTSALVRALGLLGVEEKSGRQALSRTAAEGWLVSERIGRRVRWSLSDQGRCLLSQGAQRIYGFGSEARHWDGQWVLLLISVPETRRDLRHRLRTRLTWAGFGSPTSGVWISPAAGQQAEAAAILADLDLAGQAMSLVAGYGDIGSQPEMVERSWDLRGLATLYQRFLDEFTALHPDPGDGATVLRAQTRLVHEWRRFPFLDPELPAHLLPADWIGAKATRLFRGLHRDWDHGAQRYWDQLTSQD